MSYLKFDKEQMINLDQSLPKEILRANKSGTYSYSTVVDCNTRKCHGLLVIQIPELDNNNHVLISSIDTTVIQRGAEFNLGIHKYPGNNYSPKGHKYIREYTCDYNPVTTYRVGGVILSRELIFVSFENRLIIKYTLLDAHSQTTLKFKPFLAFRNSMSLCRKNDNINKDYEEIENGFKMCLYKGYPDIAIQTSKKSIFNYDPNWYINIEYPKDQEQGYEYQEDLFVPGTIFIPIKKGESIYLSVGTAPLSPRRLRTSFEKETEVRIPRNSFTNCLKNAAYQFYNKHNDGQRYIIEGYPWFDYKARNMFIALPGCTMYAGDTKLFESIMVTGEKSINNFINKKCIDSKITGIESPDVLLWAIWAIQEYAKFCGIEQCAEKYGKITFKIINFILGNKHEYLKFTENGLLYANGKNKAITWMDSELYGHPIVPRSGYIVEFNALWYDILNFASELSSYAGKKTLKGKYLRIAKKVKNSFISTFLNKFGYLYDYVDEGKPDWSVRPNQIFAISLEYSPLERDQKKKVLDYVTKELLTPRGLRSLSPKSYGYSPTYDGSHEQRIRAYHQGTAWPWLIAPYLEAYINIYSNSGLSFAQRTIYKFEEELSERGIGTISELFDGNPPYRGRGGISYAINVAEILRIHKIIKEKLKLREQ